MARQEWKALAGVGSYRGEKGRQDRKGEACTGMYATGMARQEWRRCAQVGQERNGRIGKPRLGKQRSAWAGMERAGKQRADWDDELSLGASRQERLATALKVTVGLCTAGQAVLGLERIGTAGQECTGQERGGLGRLRGAGMERQERHCKERGGELCRGGEGQEWPLTITHTID